MKYKYTCHRCRYKFESSKNARIDKVVCPCCKQVMSPVDITDAIDDTPAQPTHQGFAAGPTFPLDLFNQFSLRPMLRSLWLQLQALHSLPPLSLKQYRRLRSLPSQPHLINR